MAWRSIAYTSLQFGTSYIYDAFETRVDSLASGCLLAAMLQRKRVRDLVDISTTLPLLSVLAFILMLLLHLGGTPFYRYTIGYTVSSLLAAFLITQLMTLSIRGPWRILEYAPVRYLGIISYPIYLCMCKVPGTGKQGWTNRTMANAAGWHIDFHRGCLRVILHYRKAISASEKTFRFKTNNFTGHG